MVHLIKYSNKTDQVDGSKWETQLYQNGSIRFGLSEVESHINAEIEQDTISLEERVDRGREFTYVFDRQKLRFLHKCTLYISRFCKSKQFDSISLDYDVGRRFPLM